MVYDFPCMNISAAKQLAKIIKKNPNKQYTVREVAEKLNVSRASANNLLAVFKICYENLGQSLDFRNGDMKKYANLKSGKPPATPSKKKVVKKKEVSAIPVI